MSVIIFFVILGIMVTVHEFGHFIAARMSGVRVEIFSIGFGKPIYKKVLSSCEFRICLIPLGGYVKLFGDEPSDTTGAADEFLSKSKRARAFIIALGPIFNYILAWLLFCAVFFIGMEVPSSRLGSVLEGQPAAEVGLQEGDLITVINNEKIDTWQDIVAAIHDSKGQTIRLTAQRSDGSHEFIISPEKLEREDAFGKKIVVSFIGVAPSDELVDVKYSFFESIFEGTKALFTLTFMTVKGLWFMITGILPFKESVTGPLGIYFITKQAASIGIGALMHLMAVISMSLGIFNLLPLPVLDGGHLFFIAIEAIRRKPLSDKVQDRITQVGFVLIMALMVFVMANDLQKFLPRIFSRGETNTTQAFEAESVVEENK